MGQQIIKQPDGKYALFSSVVNSFVMVDATREEMIGYFGNKAKKEAESVTAKVIVDLEAGKRPYYQFTMSWEEASKKQKENGNNEDPSFDDMGY